ncbi:hypothetical protein QE449_001397 [Rhodococcus sp. SORGH_AS303]|nr:hypothetical protein [Rhodococcus sp. SORGH_AS_0303]
MRTRSVGVAAFSYVTGGWTFSSLSHRMDGVGGRLRSRGHVRAAPGRVRGTVELADGLEVEDDMGGDGMGVSPCSLDRVAHVHSARPGHALHSIEGREDHLDRVDVVPSALDARLQIQSGGIQNSTAGALEQQLSGVEFDCGLREFRLCGGMLGNPGAGHAGGAGLGPFPGGTRRRRGPRRVRRTRRCTRSRGPGEPGTASFRGTRRPVRRRHGPTRTA